MLCPIPVRGSAALPLAAAMFTALPAAGAPNALDLVPEDALFVAFTDSCDDAVRNLDTFWLACGMPEDESLSSELRGSGAYDALDIARSAAVYMVPSNTPMDEPMSVGILPTADFDAFVASLDPDNTAREEDGVTILFDEDDWGNGTYLLPMANGYTAISTTPEALDLLQAGGPSYSAGRLGPNCAALADNCDAFAVIDGPNIASAYGAMINMSLGMLQMGVAADPTNPEIAQLVQYMPLIMGAKDILLDDLHTVGFGVSTDADGLLIHMGTDFIDGSNTQGFFGTAPNAKRDGLESLPNDPFVAISNLRSHPAIDAMIEAILPTPNQTFPAAQIELITNATQQASGMYSPAGEKTASPLATVTRYFSDNPQSLLHAVLEAEASPDGMVSFETSPLGIDLGGRAVHTWSMSLNHDHPTIAADPSAAMRIEMMNQMLYGRKDPGGLLVQDDESIFTTTTDDTDFAEYLLLKHKPSVADHAGVQALRKMLPENPVGEIYLSVNGIKGMLSPMLAMFTGGEPMPELPDNLPLTGGAFADQRQGLIGAWYVPTGLVSEIRQAIEAHTDGMNDSVPAPAF